MKAFHIIVLLVCAAVSVAAFFADVDDVGLYFFGWKWPLHCVLYDNFKLKCALCGMSRSFSALAAGQVEKAFYYNRVGPILFLLVFLQIPYRILAIYIYPKRINRKVQKSMNLTAAVVLSAVFVNWIVYLAGEFL